jgi:hypothetical protein
MKGKARLVVILAWSKSARLATLTSSLFASLTVQRLFVDNATEIQIKLHLATYSSGATHDDSLYDTKEHSE